jgi:hypothetical protein
VKPQVGRNNGSKGGYFKGNGGRSFTFITPHDSGIKVEGEVRDAQIIQTKGSDALIVGRNNAGVLLFEKRK